RAAPVRRTPRPAGHGGSARRPRHDPGAGEVGGGAAGRRSRLGAAVPVPRRGRRGGPLRSLGPDGTAGLRGRDLRVGDGRGGGSAELTWRRPPRKVAALSDEAPRRGTPG